MIPTGEITQSAQTDKKDYLSFSGIKRETQLCLISTACPQLFTASPSLRRDSYYKTGKLARLWSYVYNTFLFIYKARSIFAKMNPQGELYSSDKKMKNTGIKMLLKSIS